MRTAQATVSLVMLALAPACAHNGHGVRPEEGGAGGRATAGGSSATGGEAGTGGIVGAPPAPDLFISVWQTDNPGCSDDDEIDLPLVENGTYDFVVRWGDGTSDEITSWNSPARRHTYRRRGT